MTSKQIATKIEIPLNTRRMRPSYIRLDSVASTNTYLASRAADNLPHATVATTFCQTAGRGQRGNSWEADDGKNITLSILLRPVALLPRQQFFISEIVSLGIVAVLDAFLPHGDEVAIKWPNDIYVGNRKICGILIENSIMGNRITSSIAGIGLNVNQERFLSDAPNPVSMLNIAGHEFPLEEVRDRLCGEILSTFDDLGLSDATEHDDSHFADLHRRYKSRLWRREGFHPFLADGERFDARIVDIAPDGILTLADTSQRQRSFAFKEVAFVL